MHADEENAVFQTGAGSPTFCTTARDDESACAGRVIIPRNVRAPQLSTVAQVEVGVGTTCGFVRDECCLGYRH